MGTPHEGEGSPASGDHRLPGLDALLGRNLRAAGIAQIVGKLAGFLAMVVLTRHLGRVDFGRYTAAVALVTLLSVFTEFGTNRFLVREGAQRPADLPRLLGHVLQIRLLAGTATLIVAAPIGLGLGYDRLTLFAVLLFAAASGIRLVANTYLLALQALERLSDMAAVQAQHSVVQAGSMAAAALLGGGVIAVSWAVLITSALLLPWARWRLRRRWQEQIEMSTRGLATTLRAAMPFAVSAALFMSLTYLDSVMVNAFKGNAETGLYGAAYRILLAIAVVPTVYSEAIVRSLSHLATTDLSRMSHLHSRAVAHVFMVALPLAAGGVVLAEPILGFVYGRAYEDAAVALAILLGGLVFLFPSWVNVTTAYAVRLERPLVWAQVAAAVVNAGVNLVVIPRWGMNGAAAATTGTEALFLLTVGLLLRGRGVRAGPSAAVVKPALATAVMVAVVLPLRGLPLAVPLASGAVVYLATLALLRPFSPEDRELFRAVTSRGRGRKG